MKEIETSIENIEELMRVVDRNSELIQKHRDNEWPTQHAKRLHLCECYKTILQKIKAIKDLFSAIDNKLITAGNLAPLALGEGEIFELDEDFFQPKTSTEKLQGEVEELKQRFNTEKIFNQIKIEKQVEHLTRLIKTPPPEVLSAGRSPSSFHYHRNSDYQPPMTYQPESVFAIEMGDDTTRQALTT